MAEQTKASPLGDRLVGALGLEAALAEDEETRAALAELFSEWFGEKFLDHARLIVAARRREAELAAQTPEQWALLLEPYHLVPVALKWPKLGLPATSPVAGGSSSGPSPLGRPVAYKGVPRAQDRRYWDLRADNVWRCRTLGGVAQEHPVCSPVWPLTKSKDGATYAVKSATSWREVLVPAGTQWGGALELLKGAGLKLAGQTVRWVDARYPESDSGGMMRHPEEPTADLTFMFLSEHSEEMVIK